MARQSRAVLVSAVVVALVGSGFAVGVPTAGADVRVRSYTGERRLTKLPTGTTRVSTVVRHVHADVNVRLADAAVLTGTVSVQHSSTLPQSMWVNVYDARQRRVAYVDTDAAGSYRFVGLAPVRYTICAGAADDGQPTGYLAHCRTLTPAAGKTTVADLAVSHAGAIAGRVTDAAGNIVYHVDVYLYLDGKQVGPRSRNWSGHYSFVDLDPDDDYQLCFDARRSHGSQPAGSLSACTGGVRWEFGTGVPAGASYVPVSVDRTTTADITLPPAGAIGGEVFGAGSRHVRLAGSHVVVYREANGRSVVRRKRADRRGHYRVRGLPAGRYRVCATSTFRQRRCTGPTVHVAIGRTSTTDLRLRVDHNRRPTTLGKISGRVTWHGRPVRGSRVEIFDSLGSASGAGRTSANGGYVATLRPSAAGYRVCFLGGRVPGRPRSTGYASTCYGQRVWGGAAPPHHASHVVVHSGETTRGIDVTRVRGAAISGTVWADDGRSPVGHAQAIAVNAVGEVVGVTSTAADGSYTIRDLTPQAGGYTVCFVQPPSPTKGFGFIDECYRDRRWDGQMIDVVGPKHRLPSDGPRRAPAG